MLKFIGRTGLVLIAIAFIVWGNAFKHKYKHHHEWETVKVENKTFTRGKSTIQYTKYHLQCDECGEIKFRNSENVGDDDDKCNMCGGTH